MTIAIVISVISIILLLLYIFTAGAIIPGWFDEMRVFIVLLIINCLAWLWVLGRKLFSNTAMLIGIPENYLLIVIIGIIILVLLFIATNPKK